MKGAPALTRARGTPVRRGDLVLVRHGRTAWNEAGLIIGWEDPPLSATGAAEAERAGQLVAAEQLRITRVYTSLARRAVATAAEVVRHLDGPQPDVIGDWRLNERHFGQLQGLDRAAAFERFGRAAVRSWKHDRDAVPPALVTTDMAHPVHDPRYRGVDPALLPGAESMANLVVRVLACWRERIAPSLEEGHDVLIVSHLHSLNAIAAELRRSGSGAAGSRARTHAIPAFAPGEPVVFRSPVTASSHRRSHVEWPSRENEARVRM